MTDTPPNIPNHARERVRAAWIAGTRGEILLLGPAFKAIHRAGPPTPHGWMLATGEQGMAAFSGI